MGTVGKILAVVGILVIAGVIFGIIKIPKEGISISNFHYCSSINGWRDYEEHSKTYTNGEQVFMYFEVKGFEKRDDGSAQIYQTLTILKPDGSPLVLDGVTLKDYPMIDQSIDASGKDTLWFDNHLTIVNETWDRGTYNAIIKVEDRVANASTSYSSNFIIA